MLHVKASAKFRWYIDKEAVCYGNLLDMCCLPGAELRLWHELNHSEKPGHRGSSSQTAIQARGPGKLSEVGSDFLDALVDDSDVNTS